MVKEALRQLQDAMPATRGPLVTDRRREPAEATRLANTVQTWWPAVEAFLRLRVTNAVGRSRAPAFPRAPGPLADALR